jgi:predicted transcriptional regulator
MAKTKDLSKLQHYLANSPLHFYYDIDKEGNRVLRHIRVQQHNFEVPADGITIDTVPPDSVGTEQIIDKSVKMEDLNPEVTDSIADRVTQDDLDNFEV